MRENLFKNHVTAGRFTLPAAIVTATACWLLSAVLLPPSGIGSLASFVSYVGAGYLLIGMNNTFAIIRMRASVQTSVFLLLAAVCPQLHDLQPGNIAVLAVLAGMFFLFRSYQQPQPSSDVFLAFVFLGAGSLAYPKLTLYAPLFWAGCYAFRSLQVKSFFASLVGWAFPYWFLAGHAIFYGQMELLYAPFRTLVAFEPVNFRFRQEEAATMGYLLVLFAVSAGHCLVASYEDKIRTRSYLHFLIRFCCYTFLFMTLQPSEETALLPMLLAGVSFLAGHLFALTNGRSINCFFIAMFVGLFALFVFNLWMLS